MNKARQKEELYGLIGLYGFFIAVLAAVDIFYSAWSQMPLGLIVLAIIAHVGVIGTATVLFKEWKDPKFDKTRKFFFGFWLVAIFLVGGYRVAKNEWHMFQEEVDKNKQAKIDSIYDESGHLFAVDSVVVDGNRCIAIADHSVYDSSYVNRTSRLLGLPYKLIDSIYKGGAWSKINNTNP
jgi:hypothetical protein